MNRIRNHIAVLRHLVREWIAQASGARLKPAPIPVPSRPSRHRRHQAFTMIEVAISLAVIGFALVAIIGILPFAMNVQKENRQETLVNQDATTFINAIRNGERGVDDLTNYVVAITNYCWNYVQNRAEVNGYTFGGSTPPNFPITNGFRIIGLLSTPKFDGYRSNYVVAYVRSLSGLASEKVPQTNADIRDFALAYRMIVEVMPATTNFYNWSGTNFTDTAINGNTNEINIRSNAWLLARTMQTNFHDLRLTFRYPYVPGRGGRMDSQMFRTQVSGRLTATNEPGYLELSQRLFFFHPHSFAQFIP